ncbi:hypothetical protein HOI18_03225 [Candidatus Uhrbacteria bacterium]|jgi:hypothetical protein|nr:hypothetical protein [Candidatus Uhrbacteria bacterium]
MSQLAAQRAAASVLFFCCSDHRLARSQDVAIYEQVIDSLAARHGYVEPGEQVEFDPIKIPGPQITIAEGPDHQVKSVIDWSQLLVSIHGNELFIVAVHVGIGDESGCGAEGENHKNRELMIEHARTTITRLQDVFPNCVFEIMMIGVQDGRTKWAERVAPA